MENPMPKPSAKDHARIHRFLKSKFDSLDFFAKQDLQAMVPPGSGSADLWNRKLLPLLVQAEGNRFRVSEFFRKFLDKEVFLRYLSESPRATVQYRRQVKKHASFRLLLPLANELVLRDTLDYLFYSDRIARRIGILDRTILEAHFPKAAGEREAGYRKRIAEDIAGYFGGYSVHNVAGRFRGGRLLEYEEAASLSRHAGKKYVFDETSAAIDFVVPIAVEGAGPDPEGFLRAEVLKIRWLFMELLMNAILESINGEAEIWLMESGVESHIYTWKRM
jgi:hypothetical protein